MARWTIVLLHVDIHWIHTADCNTNLIGMGLTHVGPH